jgi:hypothetical protein
MTQSFAKADADVLEKTKVREVAGVFHSRDALEAAVSDLTTNGFDRSDIDLMAGVDAIKQKLGTVFVPAEELADAPRAPRRAFVAREDRVVPTSLVAAVLTYVGATAGALGVVASGGTLALAAAAAAAGGAAVGGLGSLVLSRFLEEAEADELEAQMVAGGLVLWVRVRSPAQERKAQAILRRHGAEAVRVHEIEIAKELEDLPLAHIHPDPWPGSEPLAQV